MAKNKDLSMLPSERKELTDKIEKLRQEKDQLYAAVLRKVNGIIVRSDVLTQEQKTNLLSLIWKDEQ